MFLKNKFSMTRVNIWRVCLPLVIVQGERGDGGERGSRRSPHSPLQHQCASLSHLTHHKEISNHSVRRLYHIYTAKYPTICYHLITQSHLYSEISNQFIMQGLAAALVSSYIPCEYAIMSHNWARTSLMLAELGQDLIQYKDAIFVGGDIPIIKIRQTAGLFIFIMGIPILVKWHLYTETWPWAPLNTKTVFPSMRIPVLKIRRSRDRLIFNMGIPKLVRQHLDIEMAPWRLSQYRDAVLPI